VGPGPEGGGLDVLAKESGGDREPLDVIGFEGLLAIGACEGLVGGAPVCLPSPKGFRNVGLHHIFQSRITGKADKEASVTSRSSFLLVVVAVSVGACQKSPPPAPTQQQGQATSEVTLRVGQATFVENIEISFAGVLEDSRCPVDVACVWAGNGQVALGVGPPRGSQGPTERVLLNTTQGEQSGESWGLRVTLVDLTPAPRSTQSIPPEDYLVRLKVEALGSGD
jgi:hypothetical protein